MDVELGRMCKRIIDYCRSRFIEQEVNALLKEKRFHSELVYYCDPKDSPENCVILGSVYCRALLSFTHSVTTHSIVVTHSIIVTHSIPTMELQSCLWSQEIEKSPIPEECLKEDVIVGIDEAGRGPVMGPSFLYF